MSAEQDAGKSGKKLAALLGLGSIILFGGGYIAFSKLSGSNSDMQSAVNINSAASGGTRSVTETPHYRELLRADNRNRKGYITRRYQCFPLAPLPEDRKYDSLPDLVLHPEQETIKCKEKHYSQPL